MPAKKLLPFSLPPDQRLSLGQLFWLFNLLVGIIGACYLWWFESHTKVLIPVPARNLPAYYQIRSGDLKEQDYSSKALTSDNLRDSKQIVGRYTLTVVPKQKPLSKAQLGPELTPEQVNLLTNKVVIAIPATPALVLGGNLQAGDVVDVALVQEATEKQPSPKITKFDNTLVLDVKPALGNKPTANLPSDFVIMIAIPQQRRQEFLTNSVGRKLLISRKL